MRDGWRDDLVNPLTPWRMLLLIFVVSWVLVLLEALGLPISRYGRRSGWTAALLPFVAVLGYSFCWTWCQVVERRHRRLSRKRREALTRSP